MTFSFVLGGGVGSVFVSSVTGQSPEQKAEPNNQLSECHPSM